LAGNFYGPDVLQNVFKLKLNCVYLKVMKRLHWDISLGIK